MGRREKEKGYREEIIRSTEERLKRRTRKTDQVTMRTISDQTTSRTIIIIKQTVSGELPGDMSLFVIKRDR